MDLYSALAALVEDWSDEYGRESLKRLLSRVDVPLGRQSPQVNVESVVDALELALREVGVYGPIEEAVEPYETGKALLEETDLESLILDHRPRRDLGKLPH